MRKISLIVILLISNLYLYKYLTKITEQKEQFNFCFKMHPVLINKKEIILYETNNFDFDEFFEVLCGSKYSYNYYFNEYTVCIKLNINDEEFSYQYPYQLKEKEVIKEVIYKDRIINHNSDSSMQSNDDSYKYQNSLEQEKTEYNNSSNSEMNITNSTLSYETGTDIQTILSGIMNSFTANEYVNVDYSTLNPSVPGIYSIDLYSASGNTGSISVIIQ